LVEVVEKLFDGWALAEILIVVGFGFGAFGADGAEVEGAVASAAEVFDCGHGGIAEFAVAAASFDDLAFGTFGDSAFSDGESAAKEPPEAFAEDGLFFGFEDCSGGDGGAKLADEGGLVTTGFGTVGAGRFCYELIAVGAEVGVVLWFGGC